MNRAFLIMLLATAAAAQEIDGVTVPATAQIAGQEVPLRGAALLRWKWLVKVYVAACWLPAGTTADQAMAATPKRFAFTYRRAFSAEDLIKATSGTITEGLDAAQQQALVAPLAAWNAGYRAVQSGDRIDIDHLADGTVVMAQNGAELVRVTDQAFATALSAIWLGKDTFDSGLRKRLLSE